MPAHWPREAWLVLVAGLGWLVLGSRGGLMPLVLALLPGLLMASAGTAVMLWPGDRRAVHFGAIGALTGALFGILGWWLLGLWPGAVLIALSAGAFVACGALSNRQEPSPDGVPARRDSLALAAKVAADEAIMAHLQFSLQPPTAPHAEQIHREVVAADEFFADRGWLEKPEGYHRTPPALESPEVRRESLRSLRYEHLVFESEYEPWGEEPGRERWLGYVPNRTAHAYVLRHSTGDRPWLICINGYRTGYPLADFAAFSPRFFHERLGLNMLIPVLPLHGKRRIGTQSGDGFMDGDPLDTLHAEAQAMWDIRRLQGWAERQGASGVGVHGLSLGGYTTALYASLASGLSCAIPGIAVTDFARIFWHHGSAFQLREIERREITREQVAMLFRVISPLHLEPKVPHEGRAIFGGVCDRIVPPDHQRDLFEHWGQPRMVWYQGGHLTFMTDPSVRRSIESTLRETLLSGSAAD